MGKQGPQNRLKLTSSCCRLVFRAVKKRLWFCFCRLRIAAIRSNFSLAEEKKPARRPANVEEKTLYSEGQTVDFERSDLFLYDSLTVFLSKLQITLKILYVIHPVLLQHVGGRTQPIFRLRNAGQKVSYCNPGETRADDVGGPGEHCCWSLVPVFTLNVMIVQRLDVWFK